MILTSQDGWVPAPTHQARHTLVLTAAFVLDDVFMVQGPEDLDLPLPARAELGTTSLLKGLHSHHLAGAIIGWVVAVQADLAKVALAEVGRRVRPGCRACWALFPPFFQS